MTICTHRRECIFGKIEDGEMNLNQVGTIVRDEWLRSDRVRREICLDAFLVMPYHLHGVVLILTDCGSHGIGRKGEGDRRSPLQPRGPGRRSLSSFIGGFKASCTRSINDCPGMASTSVWQRNYYEHVIRSDRALNAIRHYIETNPLKWARVIPKIPNTSTTGANDGRQGAGKNRRAGEAGRYLRNNPAVLLLESHRGPVSRLTSGTREFRCRHSMTHLHSGHR